MKKDKYPGIVHHREMHYKLRYIADYEGSSASGQVLHLINQCIRQFELEHGPIDLPREEGTEKDVDGLR